MAYYVQLYNVAGRLVASGVSPDLRAARNEARWAMTCALVCAAGARILEADGLYVEDLGVIPEPKPAPRAPVVAEGGKQRASRIPGNRRKS